MSNKRVSGALSVGRVVSAGMLAGLALAAFCGAAESGVPVSERLARDQVTALALAVTAFHSDLGRFPSEGEGLQALVACPATVEAARWRGPYLDPPELQCDPWGHSYVYALRSGDPERPFAVYSCGPDGISASGGSDPDDVGLWMADSPTADAAVTLPTLAATLRRQFAGPLGLVAVLLVLVALLRAYTARVAGSGQPHPGGYVRRHLRRQRRLAAARQGLADRRDGV